MPEEKLVFTLLSDVVQISDRHLHIVLESTLVTVHANEVFLSC